MNRVYLSFEKNEYPLIQMNVKINSVCLQVNTVLSLKLFRTYSETK